MSSVAHAAGTSIVLGIGRSGYLVNWVQIRYPHETGYQVNWAQIRLPYIIASVSVIPLPGGDGSAKARSKRPIVDDRNDLQDLCEIWELTMRKAA